MVDLNESWADVIKLTQQQALIELEAARLKTAIMNQRFDEAFTICGRQIRFHDAIKPILKKLDPGIKRSHGGRPPKEKPDGPTR